MKRVLVTGSNGQLGRCIQKAAHKYIDITFEFLDSSTLDITDTIQVTTVFKNGNFDYCINAAAYTNVEQAEKTPGIAFKVNAEGVKNIATSCLKNDVILTHISTDYVFDGKKETPYVIEDQVNPINEYGKSKLQGEKYIQEILKQYYIIRTSWLYSEYGHNFYKTILKKTKEKAVLHITDEQMGCPTDANNLAKYILDAITTTKGNYGIYHYTDGKPMTWYDFAVEILKKEGLENMLRIEKAKNYRTLAARPKNSILA